MIDTTCPVKTEDEIRDWLIREICARTGVPRDDLNLDLPVIAYGVDSVEFVSLAATLETWLDCRFVGNPLMNHPSINSLSRLLATKLRESAARDAAAGAVVDDDELATDRPSQPGNDAA
jgi:acyl carrier protein